MTPERRKALTLAATILGSAIVFVDGTVVNVALPALRDDLDASLAEQQWIVEAYLLLLGSLVLVGGSLGDLYGRRRVFTIGVAGFGLTSLLCAAAPDATTLVAFRALQGVAGALLVPSSLAVITSTFDEGERGAAIGAWTAWTSASIAVGPPLGGLLVDAVSWRLVFAINVPLVVACLLLTVRAMPACPGDAAEGHRVDWVGGALCALGLAGPVFALIQQPAEGWGDPQVAGGLVAGVVLLAAFVRWERVHPDPMLPLGVFRARAFAVGNLATLGVYAGLGGATFFVALYLQQVGGYSALAAGAALLPITLCMLVLSRRAGALAERIGARPLMVAGPLVGGAGLLLFVRLDASPDYAAEVLPAVVVFGVGLALTVAPLTAAVLAGADARHAGIASGVNNAVARVAGLLAIAVLGAVVAGAYGSRLREELPATARAAALVDEAERRPFVPLSEVDPDAGVPDAAGDRASEAAFDRGMVAGGLLVILGGLTALGMPARARPPAAPA